MDFNIAMQEDYINAEAEKSKIKFIFLILF